MHPYHLRPNKALGNPPRHSRTSRSQKSEHKLVAASHPRPATFRSPALHIGGQ